MTFVFTTLTLSYFTFTIVKVKYERVKAKEVKIPSMMVEHSSTITFAFAK